MSIVTFIFCLLLSASVLANIWLFLMYGEKCLDYDTRNIQYKNVNKELKDLITKYNRCAKSHNIWRERALSREKMKLSKEDLKRLKHYLHPDKHNGKTNDLFIKLGELSEKEY